MENSSLKRPAQAFGKFKFFKNNKADYEGKAIIQKSNNTPVRLPLQKRIPQCTYSYIQIPPKKETNKTFAYGVRQVISKLKTVVPVDLTVQAKENNAKFEEIKEKLNKILISKEKISTEIESANEMQAKSHEGFEKNLKEIQEKIQIVHEEIKKVEERSRNMRKTAKFYKDFSGLEILEVFEGPKGISARGKHEENFIQFKLIEMNSNYEYFLEATSVETALLPEVFREEIVFDKGEFRLFYLEMMEYLLSL